MPRNFSNSSLDRARHPSRGTAWPEGLRASALWRMAGGFLAGIVLLGLGGIRAWSAVAPEYQVKAELLANFAGFVNWPAGTFARSNSPVVIGVVGKDPFERFLEKAVELKTRPGRPLVMRRVSSDAEMRECHVLFVAASERRRMRDLRTRLKGAPVLTVGEYEEFMEHGGIINFLLKGQSVRFEISVVSAQAAGLRLDAKLLSVADVVHGKYD